MKRLTVFLLAMLMLLSSTAGLAEVVFPLEETVEFTVVVKQGPQDLSINYADKLGYKLLNEKTNVVINWMPFKGSTYNEKVTQMIGGNDLPDAFAGGSLDVMNNYEIYVDLLPYMEEYMPNWYKYLNEHPQEKDYLTLNGSIYCLPVAAGAEPRIGITALNSGVLYINDTFCNDYLGGKAPTTMEEFYNALVTAKTNDINGNGLGDEIPLLACNNYRQGLDALIRFFGVATSGEYVQYAEDQKHVEFFGNSENYKAALQTLSKWYAEGLINSDVYSMTYDEYSTRFNADSSMIAFCTNYTPDMTFANGLSNWTPIVFLDNPGYENIVVSKTSYECLEGMAITTACKNPEILMAFIDAINDDFEMWTQWRYGNKGEIWDYAEDGHHYYTYLMGSAVDSGLAYGKYRQTYSMHLFGLSFGGIYEDRKVEDPATEVKGAGRAWVYKTLEEMIKPEWVRNAVLRYGYWDEDLSMELDELGLAINTYCDAFKANAVVKGFTDADWDSYCNDLDKKLDLERYMELYNGYMTRND